MTRILLIEDNRSYAANVASNLEREGYEVAVAATGPDGLRIASEQPPDLIILDLMLPAMSGYTVLQRLREEGHDVRVLVMTALGTEQDKLRGFDLGADDYVVKPCGLLEILARVRALLKRGEAGSVPQSKPRLRIGDVLIDFSTREASRAGVRLPLRPKEFELLAALVRRRGAVVTRTELLREVWGYAAGIESRTVETHLAALRRHLGDDPKSPRYVLTVRGSGYRVAGVEPA